MTIYSILYFKNGEVIEIEHFKDKDEMLATYKKLPFLYNQNWDDYDWIVGVINE